MKCIYPHGVELTRQQTETFEALWVAAKKIVNTFAEIIKTVVESDEFRRVLKMLVQEQESISQPTLRFPPIEIPIPSPPMLDRRLQLPLIRNNC